MIFLVFNISFHLLEENFAWVSVANERSIFITRLFQNHISLIERKSYQQLKGASFRKRIDVAAKQFDVKTSKEEKNILLLVRKRFCYTRLHGGKNGISKFGDRIADN